MSLTLRFVLSSLLIAAGTLVVALWFGLLTLAYVGRSGGLMPWVAAGVSLFGLVFVAFGALFSVPGILWASHLVKQVEPRHARLAKVPGWIGKTSLSVGLAPALAVLVIGLVRTYRPDSDPWVAAFEVSLQTEADRNQFLSVLREAAEAEGMHVDAESEQDIERKTKLNPVFAKTMSAAVWIGANDGESVAYAMDEPDHLGQVWIMFSRGKDISLATRFRERAVRKIMQQWPDTLSLPITPTGGLALRRDLVRTPNGYIVKPSEALKYERQLNAGSVKS